MSEDALKAYEKQDPLQYLEPHHQKIAKEAFIRGYKWAKNPPVEKKPDIPTLESLKMTVAKRADQEKLAKHPWFPRR
jgi:hypothetical protein